MTQGMKTSEFLVALMPVILGLALIIIGAIKSQNNLIDTGMWLMLGGSGSYGVSRGLAKFGAGATQPAPAASTPPPADDKAAADAVAKVP